MEEEFSYENYQLWLKKRRKTFLSFCILTCCLGTEYSVIIPSLWFYVSDIEKQHTKVYYGLTLAMYYVSAILGSLAITRYVDRTRNIKKTMVILIMCEILGNVLYSIPISGYFLIIGRFIQGLGDVNMSIVSAEIARSYAPSEITSRISILVACFSTMFVIAPAFNVAFKYINFNIYGFPIYFGNLPGIFMIVFFGIVLLIVLLTVTDLSKEFDLKENFEFVKKFHEDILDSKNCKSDKHLSSSSEVTDYKQQYVRLDETLVLHKDQDSINIDDDIWIEIYKHSDQTLKQEATLMDAHERYENDSISSETTCLLTKQLIPSYIQEESSTKQNSSQEISPWMLLKSYDFILLVTLGFFMSFSMVAFLDVTMPILASKYFNFTSQTTGILFFSTGVLFIIVVQVIKVITKRFKEYYLLFGGLAVFVISVLLLIVVSILQNRYWNLGITLFCSYVLIIGTCSCVEQVIVRSLLCQIIPSSCQTFAEGVRRSTSSMACILSSFIAPLAVDYVIYLCIAMILIIMTCAGLLYKRRKTLLNPKVLTGVDDQ